jgi:hypothetical protein
LEDRLKRSGRFTIVYLNDLAFGQGKLLWWFFSHWIYPLVMTNK